MAAAFVPIGEGHLTYDCKLHKALLNPTHVYQKIGGHMWFPEFKKQQEALQTQQVSRIYPIKDFLKSLPQNRRINLMRELDFLNSLSFLPRADKSGQQPAPYNNWKSTIVRKNGTKTEDKKENLEDNLKTEAEVLKNSWKKQSLPNFSEDGFCTI